MSEALSDLVFTLTGKFEDDPKGKIAEHGGKVGATITKNTTHLLCGETEKVYGKLSGKGSTKYKAAAKKGLPILKPEHLDIMIADGREAAEKAAAKEFKTEEKEEKIAGKKRKKEAKEKKAKKAKVDPKKIKEEKAKAKELKAEATQFGLPKLKELCRLNDYKVTGTKKELVERVVDGMMYGAIPRCPKCNAGYLRVKFKGSKFGLDGQGQFSCPGHFDDSDFVSCDFESESVERVPWKTE